MDMRFFFMCDWVKAKRVDTEFVPTADMLANLHTKSVQGLLF